MSRAAELDPSSKNIMSSYKQYKAALSRQTAKDKGTYSGMFSRGSIYKQSDIEGMQANAAEVAKAQQAIEQGLKQGYFTPEAERERFEQEKAKKKMAEEMEATRQEALKYGINLDDPDTAKAIKDGTFDWRVLNTPVEPEVVADQSRVAANVANGDTASDVGTFSVCLKCLRQPTNRQNWPSLTQAVYILIGINVLYRILFTLMLPTAAPNHLPKQELSQGQVQRSTL